MTPTLDPGKLQHDIRAASVGGLVLGVLGAGVGGLGAWAAVAESFDGTLAGRLAIVAMAGVVALLLLALALIFARGRLEVFERGLRRTGLRGSTWIAFDEVTEIRLPSAWPAGMNDPLARATLATADGRRIGTAPLSLEKSLEAMRYATARIIPRLRDEAVAKLQTGVALEIGKLTATTPGILHDARMVPWTDIDRTGFSPEGLRIFLKGHAAVIVLPLGTRNAYLLASLCGAMAAQTPSAGATADVPGAATSSDTGAGGLGASGPVVRGFAGEDAVLGRLVAGRPSSRVGTIGGIVLALASAVGMVAAFAQVHSPGESPVPWLALVGIGAGALWAFVAARMGFAIYENGLRTTRQSIRWDEVDHLLHNVVDVYVNGAYSGRQVTLALEGRSGKVSIAGRGATLEAMAGAVLDRAMPRLIARRRRGIDEEGEALTCGPLTLTKTHLARKSEQVELATVSELRVERGWLYVALLGGKSWWSQIDLGTRDAKVLVALLNARVRPQAQLGR